MWTHYGRTSPVVMSVELLGRLRREFGNLIWGRDKDVFNYGNVKPVLFCGSIVKQGKRTEPKYIRVLARME